MFFTFVASVIAGCLRFLFLFVDFFVKIWLLYALFLFSFPVPVTLKRFAAALFVLIFGMMYFLLHCAFTECINTRNNIFLTFFS